MPLLLSFFRFGRCVSDLVNHQYGICRRMYPEENPQNFRLPVPCLYPRDQISFCCIRIQLFRRIPSLKTLNEKFSINDMPSICMLPPLHQTRQTLFSCLLRCVTRTPYVKSPAMPADIAESFELSQRSFMSVGKRMWLS